MARNTGFKRGILNGPTPPITVTHPQKIKFWDYERNGFSPKKFTYGSNEIMWWMCPANPGHRWQQAIMYFCQRKTNCSYCAVKPVPEKERLSTNFPAIAREWHPHRNNQLSPENVRSLSKRSVWWLCNTKSDHVWNSTIVGRSVNGEGCPFCTQKTFNQAKSLAKTARHLLPFWCEEENEDLDPNKVSPDISLVVYWQCEGQNRDNRVHKFRASINKVVKNGVTFCCRECQRKEDADYSSVAATSQHVAKQWDRKKNYGLAPEDVVAGSSLLIWWKCEKGPDHKWQATPNSRILSNTGCPFCAKKETSSTHSLAILHPELMKQWHVSRNKGKDPAKMMPNSTEKVWWKCPVAKDHVWQVTPRERSHFGSDCPFCKGRAVTKSNCLATMHPKIASQWHSELNGELSPHDVRASSRTRAFWQCSLFREHTWEASVASRTYYQTDCPLCLSFRTPKEKSLQYLYPQIAREWHGTKNGVITPQMVSAHSGKKFWWQCGANSKHVYFSKINDRISSNTGCPYCANKLISDENSFAAKYPKLARQWYHKKNGSVKPSQIAPHSKEKVWWRCPKGPDHEWFVAPEQRVSKNNGCPYCAGKGFSITHTLAWRHPKIAKQWHKKKNGKLTPEKIKTSDLRPVWWVCLTNPKHVWKSIIRVRIKAKNPCPIC